MTQGTAPSCYNCYYSRHRQNLGLVEAQNFAPSVWAPGAEGASGATGYFGSIRSLEAGFLFWGKGELEGKGGDGTRLAFEEIGRARGRTLVLAMDRPIQDAQPPQTGILLPWGNGVNMLLSLENSRGRPSKGERPRC